MLTAPAPTAPAPVPTPRRTQPPLAPRRPPDDARAHARVPGLRLPQLEDVAAEAFANV